MGTKKKSLDTGVVSVFHVQTSYLDGRFRLTFQVTFEVLHLEVDPPHQRLALANIL